MAELLNLQGKCQPLRAKPAHFVSHLPPAPEKKPYLGNPLSEVRQRATTNGESHSLQIGDYHQAMDSMEARDHLGNRYVIDYALYQRAYACYQEQTGQGEQAFRAHYWTSTQPGVQPLINEQQDAPKHLCQSCEACQALVYRYVILDTDGYSWLCRSCYQALVA